MNKHWKYLKYVVRHKYYVYKAGRVTGAPLWRLIIHDWSKFTPAEWSPYVENFYGTPLPKDEGGWTALMREVRKQNFRYAFLHHVHRNPHHWEHWVLKEAQPIPEHFVREMVADWHGAGRAIAGRWEGVEWWNNNRGRINLHPQTRVLTEQILQESSALLHNK